MEKEIVKPEGEGILSEKGFIRHKGIHGQWGIKILKRITEIVPDVGKSKIHTRVPEDKDPVIPQMEEIKGIRGKVKKKGNEEKEKNS